MLVLSYRRLNFKIFTVYRNCLFRTVNATYFSAFTTELKDEYVVDGKDAVFTCVARTTANYSPAYSW